MQQAVLDRFKELADGSYQYPNCLRRAYMLAGAMIKVGIGAGEINMLQIRPFDEEGSLHPVCIDDVVWKQHYAIEQDGEVYDPLAGEPMPTDEYLDTMFKDHTKESLKVTKYTILSAIEDFVFAGDFC